VCHQVGINEIIKGTRQNPITHKKEVGMFEKWKLIRSHIGRRSFATNHYNVLPNKVIMAVTGHSTEKQFLKYIGEVESDHLQIFIDQWRKKADT
jgi:integrase